LFLPADDAEGGNLLECRYEMTVEIGPYCWVGQCVRTERLGVVSGEAEVLEIPRDVQQEGELALLAGGASGFPRIASEGHGSSKSYAAGRWLGAGLAPVINKWLWLQGRVLALLSRFHVREIHQGYKPVLANRARHAARHDHWRRRNPWLQGRPSERDIGIRQVWSPASQRQRHHG
jgi:hypothetical protein